MADMKTFIISNNVTIQGICNEVEMQLQNDYGLITERISTNHGYIIQAREASNLKKIIGLGKSLYVKIDSVGTEQVNVFIDKGKWSDRDGIMNVVGRAVPFIPNFDIIGAFKQYKLPQEVFSCIEKFIVYDGRSAYLGARIKCSQCGAINPPGLKSCASCGKLFET